MMPFALFTFALGAAVAAVLRVLPHKTWHPPFTVVMFLLGFFMHGVNDFGDVNHNALGALGESIVAWNAVHPHVILFVLLPPLLFESAFNMNFHVFKRVAMSSLLLAGPGVMLCILLTSFLLYFFFATYNWSLPMIFMVSSILSATDPVAVVAVLHTLGAPAKLSTLIEGESLLNDGSAFVMFLIFQGIIAGGFTTAKGVGMLFQLAGGGVLWGLFMAKVTYTWYALCLLVVFCHSDLFAPPQGALHLE
jgi:NhaP-type Na+/H+ or K+/H+ antiporter